MFRALFCATLFVTLMVNIIFLFATKDKPPDLAASTTLVSVSGDQAAPTSARRLFLRSNDFYDYGTVANQFSVGESKLSENSTSANGQINRLYLPPSSTTNGIRQVSSQWSEQPARANLMKRKGTDNNDAITTKRTVKTASTTTTTTTKTFAYDNYNRRESQPHQRPRPDVGNDNEIKLVHWEGAALRDANGIENVVEQQRQRQPMTTTTIKTTSEKQRPSIELRVKSSKNHVLISLDNLIIYQSGRPNTAASSAEIVSFNDKNETTTTTTTRASAYRKRKQGDNGRRRRRRRRFNKGNANQMKSGRVAAGGEGDWEEEENNNTNNDNNEEASRGIHVLVLSQFDGSIMAKRVFDTYSPQHDDELAAFLSQIQLGRILVLAVRDEASFKMARQSAARKLIKLMGSHHIQQLGWRDMWALVLIKQLRLETSTQIGSAGAHGRRVNNDNNLAEAISHSVSFSQWARPVEISARIWLEDNTNDVAMSACFKEQRRRDFCSRVEGYGRVCDCKEPSKIEFHSLAIESSHLDDVPIVVIASNRPYYLYRMLKSLLQAQGVRPHLVTVFIDGFYQEPVEVCKLFNLRYVQHRPTGTRSARISNHYKQSLTYTFSQLFPKASHALIFEEDLDVAPDALVYFNQTLPLLRNDPTLYCVSAWNDQGYEHSVGDLRRVYRIETMPGLGWILSRDLFIGELQAAWPDASQQHDWDMWIRTPAVRRGRECLIPDVSRTFHFGSSGTNINSYFQRQYFSKHAFSANYLDDQQGAIVFANLDRLGPEDYDLEMDRLIGQESNLITTDSSENISASGRVKLERDYLCSLVNISFDLAYANERSNGDDNNNGILNINRGNWNGGSKAAETTRTTTNSVTNVIFIQMIDSQDYGNWLELAKCWHLWDLDARGQHKSAWRLYLNGQAHVVVGYPASPFSRWKPPRLKPFNLVTQQASSRAIDAK